MATSPTGGDATDQYAEGWRQLHEHLRSGQSWSGNERHCVFLNTGTPTFSDASAVTGLDFPDDGRGLAIVDWDLDGDLDLWFTNRSGPRARFLRNDSNNANSYIAFRLRSDSLNSDGIGAEVELFFEGEDRERHVRTLRAGSGFISQSSKWVHFGVPEGRSVSHASVRWPSGAKTTHHDLSAGGRWILREGRAEPARWQLPAAAQVLTEGALPSGPPDSSARIPIIHPLPLLGLSVEGADGRRTPIQPAPDGGVLITLWANWCVNCKRELAQLQAEQETMREAGLRVIAVNVDDPKERPSGDAFLDQISWDFERAYANQSLLDIFAVAQRVILDLHKEDSIPTSYLMDGQGRLQVIYRGPVPAAQIAADAKAFDDPPVERRREFGRYGGWWSTDDIPTRYTMMAIQLRNRGYPELSSEYLKRITIRGDADDAPQFAVERIFGSEINTGIELLDRGNPGQAAEVFRRALALKPNHPVANKLLGTSLHELGEVSEAIKHLEIAILQDPDYAEARFSYGVSLLELDRIEEAAQAFRETIRLDETMPRPHFNLGVYHALKNEFEEATRHITEALRLNPDYVQAWTALGRVHLIEGRPGDAISAFERSLSLNGSDPEVLLLLGGSFINAGRPEDARALIPKLRELDPVRAADLAERLSP